jgi:hypothetical protein
MRLVFERLVLLMVSFGLFFGRHLSTESQYCCCVAVGIAVVDSSSCDGFEGRRMEFWLLRDFDLANLEAG